MDTAHRELDELVTGCAPPLIEPAQLEDFEQLERLVTEDELRVFDDECSVHYGCLPVFRHRLAS